MRFVVVDEELPSEKINKFSENDVRAFFRFLEHPKGTYKHFKKTNFSRHVKVSRLSRVSSFTYYKIKYIVVKEGRYGRFDTLDMMIGDSDVRRFGEVV